MNDFLIAKDDLTQAIVESGLVSWSDLLRSVANFQYKRISDPYKTRLVWEERCGTCSSKHAFLKQVADLNKIHVHLYIGIFRMNALNTPKIASVLKTHELDYLPEAHCYLKNGDQVIDVTSADIDPELVQKDLIEEYELEVRDVIYRKVEIHQTFLKKWIEEHRIPFTLEDLWKIRETCIAELSK